MAIIAAMAFWTAGGGPSLPIDTNTTISVALLVVVLGAIWRLATALARIEFNQKLLKHIPAHLRHIETHLIQQEEDLNNLWAAARCEDPARLLEVTRRARYVPFPNEN